MALLAAQTSLAVQQEPDSEDEEENGGRIRGDQVGEEDHGDGEEEGNIDDHDGEEGERESGDNEEIASSQDLFLTQVSQRR